MKTTTKRAEESAKIVEHAKELVKKTISSRVVVEYMFKNKEFKIPSKLIISQQFINEKGFSRNKQFLETKQNNSILEENMFTLQRQLTIIINHPLQYKMGDF